MEYKDKVWLHTEEDVISDVEILIAHLKQAITECESEGFMTSVFAIERAIILIKARN